VSDSGSVELSSIHIDKVAGQVHIGPSTQLEVIALRTWHGLVRMMYSRVFLSGLSKSHPHSPA
jgi:hypothetical protein